MSSENNTSTLSNLFNSAEFKDNIKNLAKTYALPALAATAGSGILGGILALNYAIEYPGKVKSLVLIGTPHKVPKIMFSIQNVIFRLLPKSTFKSMAFEKKDTFILGSTMKKIVDKINHKGFV